MANPQKILFLLKALKPLKDIENKWGISASARLSGQLSMFQMVLDDSTLKAFMENNNFKQEKQTNPEQHVELY